MRLTAKDLSNVVDFLASTGQDPEGVAADAALTHLYHGGKLMDAAPVVERWLKEDAEGYLAAYAPYARDYRATPHEGATVRLAYPVEGLPEMVTVHQLKGADWQMALTNSSRIGRVAAMSDLSQADILKLDLSDYLGIENATFPFVERLLEILTDGGTSPGS